MSPSDTIRCELSSAVRLLGEEGANAKVQNTIAAREAGLPVRLVERLRWKQIKNPAAYVADAIREAVERKQARINERARHEIAIITARLQTLEARLDTTDSEFFGAEAIPALQSLRGHGSLAGPKPSSKTEGGKE